MPFERSYDTNQPPKVVLPQFGQRIRNALDWLRDHSDDPNTPPSPSPAPTPSPEPAPSALKITGTPPNTGVVGELYLFIPTVTGGSGAKSFVLANGVLLGGLTFNPLTGTISGFPNVTGSMAGIVVRVIDQTGSANTQATNINITTEATDQPVVFPTVQMARFDIMPPVEYTSQKQFGPVNTGMTSFDVYAKFPSGDAAGEFSIGRDTSNRFRFYFGGASGTDLQIVAIRNGTISPIPIVNTVPKLDANGELRFRIATLESGAQQLSVLINSVLTRITNPVEAISDATNFWWRTDHPTNAVDIRSSATNNPLVLGVPQMVNLRDSRARIPLTYSTFARQPDPAGFKIRQRSLDGTVLVDWEDALCVSSDRPGQMDIVTKTKYTGSRGTIVYLDVRHTSAPEVAIYNAELFYPEKLVIGQNIANLTGYISAFRPQAVWTNMFMQGYWQEYNTAAKDTPGRNTPGKIDALGWPLKAEMDFWYRLPDELTEQEYVLEWTGGDATWAHNNNGIDGGVVALGPMQQITSRRIEWKIQGDRRLAKGGPSCRLRLLAIDPANPPKNLKLYRKGDDITQRFCTSFIDFLKLTPGPMRFMDDRGVNGELTRLGKPWVWAQRPIQDAGAVGQLSVEDMVELSYRTGRAVHYNVHSSFAYEEGGLDYFDRELDIMYGRTPGIYSTPGFSAPGGCGGPIKPEIDNEVWNEGGFGYVGSYQYMVEAGHKYNIVPTFDITNGSQRQGVIYKMRNITQARLMKRLQDRIPDWRARTSRVLGVQMGASDIGNLVLDPTWAEAKNYIDEVHCAPYIPNDPNAGGQAANVPDKSPLGICVFLAKSANETVMPILIKQASIIAKLGFKFGIYEVNVSIPSLGVTLAQNLALQSSIEYYNVWYNVILPMLARFGGMIALYSDVGPILVGTQQQWSLFHIPNTEFNKSWDAVVDWSKVN